MPGVRQTGIIEVQRKLNLPATGQVCSRSRMQKGLGIAGDSPGNGESKYNRKQVGR